LHAGAHLGGFVTYFVGSHSQQGLGVFDGEFNVLHDTGSLGCAMGTHGAIFLKNQGDGHFKGTGLLRY
jgi:hypothetical protein